MCGFVALLTGRNSIKSVIDAMGDQIRHRGPDDRGSWCAQEVGLGHLRLSILELSQAGHQPMMSANERWVIAFNGEIYNHLEIRKELETSGVSSKWRGHSDTETILEAVSHYGVSETIQQLVGMFAFALWDRQEKKLWLIRDRMGEKPLYYGRVGTDWVVASEIKAFTAHPDWHPQIDQRALAGFLRYNCVPTPLCIYENIKKLTPGCYLQLSPLAVDWPEPAPYWSVASIARNSPVFSGDPREKIDELDHLLRKSVAGQMMSDVPLGAFLSGGIDSSLVVALMQAQSSRPIRTFSIGFAENGYNEAPYAAAVARHLGTEHTEFLVTPEEAQAVIPKIAGIWDEPFADSSQIPTLLVCELARRHVTVALSGDGGDELFAGYTRYPHALRMRRNVMRFPTPLRTFAAACMKSVSPHLWDSLLRPTGLSSMRITGDRIHKLADLLSVKDSKSLYSHFIAHWRPQDLLSQEISGERNDIHLPDILSTMQLTDQVGYLPDDILVKVDRAAMSVSLETRVPLLDHRIVEFAWRVPPEWRIREGQGKWILRQVLYRHVPQKILDRPKMGFRIPLCSWLRGPLRDWAEALLSEDRLKREGILNPKPVRQRWTEHISGERNWQYHLWDVLMFQAWREHWLK